MLWTDVRPDVEAPPPLLAGKRNPSSASAMNHSQGRELTFTPLVSTSLNQTVRLFESPPPDEKTTSGNQCCHRSGSQRRTCFCQGLSLLNGSLSGIAASSVKREPLGKTIVVDRSEERRVGKECRSRWS